MTLERMFLCYVQVVVARDVMSPLVNISDGNGAAACPIMPLVSTKVAPGRAASYSSPAASSNPAYYSSTLSMRTTAISLQDILDENPADLPPRKTKIVCTLGPACWSEEGLGELLDAGLNVARFNFSHGDHEGHTEVSPV
jgi:pyruvate kinase